MTVLVSGLLGFARHGVETGDFGEVTVNRLLELIFLELADVGEKQLLLGIELVNEGGEVVPASTVSPVLVARLVACGMAARVVHMGRGLHCFYNYLKFY